MSPGLTSRYRGPAFRAIEAVLREYPPLAEHVKTWRVRSGDADDLAMPGLGEMPLVALSPVPRPNSSMAVDLTHINFAVSVQVFVEGTRVEDILAVWEAIEDAIVDRQPFRNTTVQQFLCSCLSPAPNPTGVQGLRPAVPAFFPVDLAGPVPHPEYQRGDGTLTCRISRPA